MSGQLFLTVLRFEQSRVRSELEIDELLRFGGPEDDGQQNKDRGQRRFDIGCPSFVLPVVELAFVEGVEQ